MPRFSQGENQSLRLLRPRELTRKTVFFLSQHRQFKMSI
ncbi:hypothetical protein T12_10976, partial [Trichinella patagoniensis]